MRILLISYYFPPCGGAAVQRWHRWLPHLVKSGIEVQVLTSEGGDYPILDDSLLQEVPPSVKIWRSPAPRLGSIWLKLFGKDSRMPHGSLEYHEHRGMLKRILLWLRLNLVIPDLRVFWNPWAYRLARKLIRETPFDLIVTTGPPHSSHLIGLKLKKRFHLRWIADFRDPWSEIHYLKLNPPSKLSLYFHKRMERKVVSSADKCLVVSHNISARLPEGNKTVIYNGFDADKMDKIAYIPNSNFRVKYIGQITAGQDWEGLLSIISGLRDDAEISFIGTKLSPMQSRQLKDALGDRARLLPHQKQTDALCEMINSELLILMINYYEGSQGMLTTKLFEYIGSRTPILALGPHGGEAEKCLLEHHAGAYFDKSELRLALDFASIVKQAWHKRSDLRNASDLSALSSKQQSLRLIMELNTKNSH
ncbi:MAG: glycosyltransferase [Candidatus Cloacimonadaceae bacterium]|nr:glycosyltransferase [Candidatus Cloacimonadaceae bacterium]MDP3113640.1 glycosyltransferase [Candidatus Cloacimonadaceae bacterium]